MVNKRRYTDEQLTEAIASSSTWVEVSTKLGRAPNRSSGGLREVADLLGINHDHVGGGSMAQLPSSRIMQHSFPTRCEAGNNLQNEAVLQAMSWFMTRGYVVSMPLQPTTYDFVSESIDGLKRIQVKTSRRLDRGSYLVQLKRSSYVKANGEIPGRYLGARYLPDEVDYFFIVCGNGDQYLIPYGAVVGLIAISVTRKYAPYKV